MSFGCLSQRHEVRVLLRVPRLGERRDHLQLVGDNNGVDVKHGIAGSYLVAL